MQKVITQNRRDRSADERLLQMLVEAPASGFEISRRVHSKRLPPFDSARSIYVALHRLERLGLVDGEWRGVSGRPLEVRQYTVTTRGIRALCEDQAAQTFPFHPATVLVLLTVCGGWTTGEAARKGVPRVAVVLHRRVPISQQDLLQVSIEVNRILGAVGIRIDWIVEGSSTAPPRPGDAYVIHAELMTFRSSVHQPVAGEIVLGLTTRVNIDSGVADIVLFADHVREFAAQQQKDATKILALVVAHEVGHALLQTPTHGDSGIMQVPWDRQALDLADDGALLFTARQGVAMRERLKRCCTQAARN